MTDRDINDSKAAQQPVMMPAYFPQPSDEIDLFELVEQLCEGSSPSFLLWSYPWHLGRG